jgi:hypothetical protein
MVHIVTSGIQRVNNDPQNTFSSILSKYRGTSTYYENLAEQHDLSHNFLSDPYASFLADGQYSTPNTTLGGGVKIAISE